MKISELRQKSKEDLKSLLEEKQRRIDELRFLLHQKKVKNVKELSSVKRDVARVMTILRQDKRINAKYMNDTNYTNSSS